MNMTPESMAKSIENMELRSQELQRQRMQLWREIAVAVARAEIPYDPSVPTKWADAVLDAFDAKFAAK